MYGISSCTISISLVAPAFYLKNLSSISSFPLNTFILADPYYIYLRWPKSFNVMN